MVKGYRVAMPSRGLILIKLEVALMIMEAYLDNNNSGLIAKGFHTDHHKGNSASTYTSRHTTKYLGKCIENVDSSGGYLCSPGTPVLPRTPMSRRTPCILAKAHV